MIRKFLATLTACLIFWTLGVLILLLATRYSLFDIPPQIIINFPEIVAMVLVQTPFLASSALSAFISGITGTLILRERHYFLLSVPITLITMYFFTGDMQGYRKFFIIVYSSNSILSCISCIFGVWLIAKIRHYPELG